MNDLHQPLYVQVAEKMRNNIRIGKWREGHKIPTEFELCDIYHVSRITVRKAIEELARENLLIRKRAKGTFVKERAKLEDREGYTLIKGFTREMKEIGIYVETFKVDVIVSHADANVAKYLNISPGDKIIILKRLRGEKGRIFAYFKTYFKFEEFFSLNSNDYKGSFYAYLSSLGITIENDKEVVEAILPNKELATMLKIKHYTPVLKRSRFTCDVSRNFYEYTECFYIGTEYKYFIDFS